MHIAYNAEYLALHSFCERHAVKDRLLCVPKNILQIVVIVMN